MTGAFFFANAFFLRIILTLSPTSISGYVLLRFARKDTFNLASNSFFFFLASNGVILVTDETILLLYVNSISKL